MRIVLAPYLVVFAITPLYAQQIEMKFDNGSASFQKVIQIDSTSAQELYKRCDRWVLQTFKDPAVVVKARIENEEIRGEGVSMSAVTLSQFPLVQGNMHYTFKLEVKDNRARITIFKMGVSTTGAGQYPIESYIYKADGSVRQGKQAAIVKESATTTANNLIGYFESTITEKKKKEDW